jgi:hypothetical protein
MSRVSSRIREDPRVGSNQTSGALEVQVEAAFAQVVPSTLEGVARAVWMAHGGCAIVHSFKLIKAAYLSLESTRNAMVAAHITGATDVDVDRVAMMLYNAKGSLVDAYDAIGNKERVIGPHFSFEEARMRMEEKGFLQQLESDRRVVMEANASLADLESSEVPKNESRKLRSTGETALQSIVKPVV